MNKNIKEFLVQVLIMIANIFIVGALLRVGAKIITHNHVPYTKYNFLEFGAIIIVITDIIAYTVKNSNKEEDPKVEITILDEEKNENKEK